jgi:hypothetical protein
MERADDRLLACLAAPVALRADEASAWKSSHPLPAGAAVFGEASGPAGSLRTSTCSLNMVPGEHVRVEAEGEMMDREMGRDGFLLALFQYRECKQPVTRHFYRFSM